MSRLTSFRCAVLLIAAGCGDDGMVGDDGGADARPGDGAAGDGAADGAPRDGAGGDGAAICSGPADCDDGFFCNGAERCAPEDAAAGADGCAPPIDPACSDTEACDELGDACEDTCDLDLCASDADCEAALCAGALCQPDSLRADDFGCVLTMVCPCTSDEDCADGLYCDGSEVCDPDAVGADERGCRFGLPIICGLGRPCREDLDRCCTRTTCPCQADADCDDGLFCNGEERCYADHPRANEQGCVAFVESGTVCTLVACDEAMDCCRTSPTTCSAAGAVGWCGVDADLDGDGHDWEECAGDDCDDSDPGRYRGNAEVCDTMDHDEDCDPMTFGRRDMDGDAFYDDRCCNLAGGARICGNDCDDAQGAVHPTSTEACNRVDDDCDGSIDELVNVAVYRDMDGDGFGSAGCADRGCAGTTGYATMAGDCNDASAAIRPGESTCGSDPALLLSCTGDGSYAEARCPAGTRCRLQPDGSGTCM